MVRMLLNDSITIIGVESEVSICGVIQNIASPHLTVGLHEVSSIRLGDRVTINLVRDNVIITFVGMVMELSANQAKFFIEDQEIVAGVERAPRAVAPGTTVSVTLNNETVIGSLCDVSESGLRIKSLSAYDIGDEIKIHFETEVGPIDFTGRVARVVLLPESEDCEIGIQVGEIDRLNRARYNHFVDGLLRRARKAS